MLQVPPALSAPAESTGNRATPSLSRVQASQLAQACDRCFQSSITATASAMVLDGVSHQLTGATQGLVKLPRSRLPSQRQSAFPWPLVSRGPPPSIPSKTPPVTALMHPYGYQGTPRHPALLGPSPPCELQSFLSNSTEAPAGSSKACANRLTTASLWSEGALPELLRVSSRAADSARVPRTSRYSAIFPAS